MKIPEYPEVLQVGDDDYFIVETEAGTKKVKKGAFASNVTFDDEVTEEGVNAVRSKDIYKFVEDEIQPLDLSNIIKLSQDRTGAYELNITYNPDDLKNIILLGTRAKAGISALNSISIGTGAQTGDSSGNCIAIGYNAKTGILGQGQLALGYNARATKRYEVAIGGDNTPVTLNCSELNIKINGEDTSLPNELTEADIDDIKSVFAL